MSDDTQLTPGWKATIVVTLVMAVVAIGVSAFGRSGDPRLADHQQRIRDLESKVQLLEATKGGAAPKPRDYGE